MFESHRIEAKRPTIASYRTLSKNVQAHRKSEGSWYDGTYDSIRDRLRVISGLLHDCDAVLSTLDEHEDLVSLAQVVDWRNDLLEQRSMLLEEQREEILESKSGYRIAAAGLSAVESEDLSLTDWQEFMSVEPRSFVRQNLSALYSESEMRIRAQEFIEEETSLCGKSRRASLQREFLQRVGSEQKRALMQKSKRSVRTSRRKNKESFSDSMLFI